MNRRSVLIAAGAAAVGAVALGGYALTRDLSDDTTEAHAVGYRIVDEQQLTVVVTVAPRAEIVSSGAEESDDRVTVRVRVREPGGTGTDRGVDREVTVRLREPLGEREVFDHQGRELQPLP